MAPIKRLLLMFVLTCMWSPSFVFIKMAVQELPPLTVVSLRVSIAAVIFIGILLVKRTRMPTDPAIWLRMGIMAMFSSIVPFSLFCYAEQTIDSAMAAIMNGTTPMFTAILAQLFVASDKMDTQKVIGVLASCIGLVILFTPNLMEGVDANTLGMSAALLAAFCYAVSHVYGKLYTTGLKPYVAPTMQFILSGLILWPLAFYHDRVWTLPVPSASAIAGVAGLVALGTCTAFIIYYKLLESSGPTAISTVACFFPVVGMFLGFLLFDEIFSETGLIAAAVISFGMLSVNEVISLNFSKKKIATGVEIVEKGSS